MPTSLSFTIPGWCNGPDGAANGGYACGVIAQLSLERYGPAVGVALHAPVPMDTPLELIIGERRAHARQGRRVLATVAPTAAAIEPPPPVRPEAAMTASAGFRGDAGHPFPRCFVCGVGRPAGTGLELRPGPVPTLPNTVACTWTPGSSATDVDGTVRPELVWSVLDCPGGWTGDPVSEPAVLGWMTARLHRPVWPGERCVIVGHVAERHGRAATVFTAIYRDDGALGASARAEWIALAPSAC